MEYTKQYINGSWREGSGTSYYEDVNPYNNEVVTRIKLGDKSDIDEAYEAARQAQKQWAQVPAAEKQRVMLKAAELFEQQQSEVIDILVRETGSSVLKSTIEVLTTIDLIKDTATYPERVGVAEHLTSSVPGKENLVYHEPAGVVSVISPFNWPLYLTMRSVAPAIAVGDAVVLKPDVQTAISGGLVLAKIFEEAGLPKGVLNVLTLDIAQIGDYFVEHPVPRIISFTGSTNVGRHMGEVAGRNLKRVALELGGNSPIVVLSDADVDQAVNAAIFGKFIHQGQICMITNRILVHRNLYDTFVERFVERAKAIPFGDPTDPNVIIGPIINERQINKILGIIEQGKKEGAKLVLEGKRVGNILTPYVFADVRNDSVLAQSEIFGPVATIIPFDSDEEGIRLANETEYGLSSSVFTKDLDRGVELARRIEAGMTHVNDQTVNVETNTPFGGEKASGIGRYCGQWAFEEFTTAKWVSVQKTPREFPF